MSSTCPSCGARVKEEQSQCDLCGLSLPSSEASSTSGHEETDSLGAGETNACSVCGSTNPEGSRFCNQCGSKISEVRPASALVDLPSGETSKEGDSANADAGGEDEMVKRVLFTVGAGVLLMMLLYGVTLMSESRSPNSSSSPSTNMSAEPPSNQAAPEADAAASSPEPLSGDLVEEAESLKQSIASASNTSERVDFQQELVRLYVQADRQDLAGDVQEQIAQAEETAMAWADAGNLYYDWMMQQQSRAGQTQYAKKAISAYQKSLEIDPTNLDVRTDMAVAYLYDPDNPMQAIQETKKVLEEDPDHIQANFNRGIMLLRINRVEEAIKQFERVKSLASSDSPVYQRTENVLERIRQQQ